LSKRQEQLAVSVLKQFRIIYGSVRAHFRAVERRCGLGGSQLWLLQEVRKSPGVGVSELALKLSIHQSTCSQLVERLAEQGYLRRVRMVSDKRRVGLRLTARALTALRRAPAPAEGILPAALIGLSAGDLRALHSQLDKLIGQLRRRDERSAHKLLSSLGLSV